MSKQSEYFWQLQSYHMHQKRHTNSLSSILSGAKEILRTIRDSGQYISDTTYRASLESYANYWGDLLFELGDAAQYPDTSLLHYDEDYDLSIVSIGVQEKSIPDFSIVNASFYGREKELSELSQWILKDDYRLLAVLGEGGIGKTSLVEKLLTSEDINRKFQGRILWRSLRASPYIDDLIGYFIYDLSGGKDRSLPKKTDARISYLINEYLSKYPCLLVLDNYEEVQRGEQGSKNVFYQRQRDGYDKLLRRIGQTGHKSCLLITCRLPKPESIFDLEQDRFGFSSRPVRSLLLGELPLESAMKILDSYGLSDLRREDAEELYEISHGRPFSLKSLARTISAHKEQIKEQFDGDIHRFLEDEKYSDDSHYGFFLKEFANVSETNNQNKLKSEILYWLAIEQKPISLDMLIGDLYPDMRADDTLRGRVKGSLECLSHYFEIVDGLYALRSDLAEEVIKLLIDKVCHELKNNEFNLLDSHSLFAPSREGFVREYQRDTFLQPVITHFANSIGPGMNLDQAEVELREKVKLLAQELFELSGYAAGNLLNLLIALNISSQECKEADLSGIDCHGLTIHQVHFHDVILHQSNFEDCRLYKCIFNKPFSSPLTVSFRPKSKNIVVGNASGKVYFMEIDDDQLFSIVQPMDPKLEKLNCSNSHTNRVRMVTFSQDGSLLSSAGDDTRIMIYRLDDPDSVVKVIPESKRHMLPIRAIAFSPQSSYLASSSDDSLIKLWEWNQENNTYEFKVDFTGHKDGVWGVSFHPKGKTLASASADGTVRLWNLEEVENNGRGEFSVRDSVHNLRCEEGKLQAVKDGVEWGKGVWCIAFSPDGKWLASGDEEGTVRVWEVMDKDAKLFHTPKKLDLHDGVGVLSVAFSPNSKYLASGSDDESIQIWKFEPEDKQWRLHRRLWKHTSRVWDVSFSDDNQYLVSCSDDQTIRFWRVEDGSFLDKQQGFSTKVLSVSFHPLANYPVIASAHEDQKIRIWCHNSSGSSSTIHLQEQLPPRGEEGHRSWVWSVAYSPNGRLLASSSDDETIRIWEAGTNKYKCLKQIKGFPKLKEGHVGWIRSVTFSPNSKLLASASDDNTLKIWDLSNLDSVEELKPLRTLRGHTDWVRSVAFNQTGTLLASVSDDGSVRIWDAMSEECKCCLSRVPKSCLFSVSFSPLDPMRFVTGGEDRNVIVWDLKHYEGKIISNHRILGNHDKAIWSVVISQDGQWVASGSDDQTVKIWNIETGEIQKLEGHASRVRSVAFSKDGHWLASASEDETIRLWKKDRDKFILNDAIRAPRPYEGMRIKGISGLSDMEIEDLKNLGATDQ